MEKYINPVSIDSEQVLASTVYFLLEGGSELDRAAATILLSCSLNIESLGDRWDNEVDEMFHWFNVRIECPRIAYDILSDTNNEQRNQIVSALYAIIPSPTYSPAFESINIRARLMEFGSDWRKELHEAIDKKIASNQGTFLKPKDIKSWNGFFFASMAEVQIAKALDKKGVLFFPNCKARLRAGNGNASLFPDFLLCYQGKWGVLEVDGPTHYIQSKVTADRSRDQNLRAYGIYVDRFDWKECEQYPERVVSRFLELILQAKN